MVVDDEKGIREALTQLLEYEEIEVRACASDRRRCSATPEFRPHLVFLDVKMQGMDGLETLRKLRELDPHAQVVMNLRSRDDPDSGRGHPARPHTISWKSLPHRPHPATLRNALRTWTLPARTYVSGRGTRAVRDRPVRDRAVKQVIERIEKVAPTAARVLITGETVPGRSSWPARFTRSPARSRPFVEVNCAAIPTELIESELFGHMKGSFTGAFADRAGKFELADGGTLFLDEIGDMSLSAQAKVLRALEEGVISRVGSGRTLPVDVRSWPPPTKTCRQRSRRGGFGRTCSTGSTSCRSRCRRCARDRTPPTGGTARRALREPDDRSGDCRPSHFDAEAVEQLAARDWPGNIRELRNAIERLLILATGPAVTAQDVERMPAWNGGRRPRGERADVAGAPWMRAATF